MLRTLRQFLATLARKFSGKIFKLLHAHLTWHILPLDLPFA